MLRREFVAGGLAVLFASTATAIGHEGGEQFELAPEFAPQDVEFFGYAPGTVVIDPGNHFLYLVGEGSRALRYGVGVGRAGRTFKGVATIERKAEWPSWRPTDNMIRRNPRKYARYARGLRGGPNNPLGARGLYLYKDGRDTMYRIHGTNEPWSIGQSVSNGCIRMLNEHVIDLYERIPLGTTVVVL